MFSHTPKLHGTLADAGFRSLKQFSEMIWKISIGFPEPGKQMVYALRFSVKFQRHTGRNTQFDAAAGGGLGRNRVAAGSDQTEMMANGRLPGQ